MFTLLCVIFHPAGRKTTLFGGQALQLMLAQALRKEPLQERARALGLGRCYGRRLLAGRAMAGRAAHDTGLDHAGEQAAAIDTRAAMRGVRQMVLLMGVAPGCGISALAAQVDRLFDRAVLHRAPLRIAHPADSIAYVAGHHLDIRPKISIAHTTPLYALATAPRRALDCYGDHLATKKLPAEASRIAMPPHCTRKNARIK
jgi:hypothetical protein